MANNPTSDKAKDLASTAGRAAADVKNKAQDLGAAAYGQAMDTASHLADKAKDVASTVGQKASDAASYVGHKAEDATSSAGSGLKSLAGQVRQNAPREGMFGSAAGHVASALDSTGQYLEDQGLSGVAEDFTGLIRRNPIPALLIGVAVGFLLAKATSSRS
jgi:ElaB/YqjD/DUF883 family membrane-anchored ribosome-binding protein